VPDAGLKVPVVVAVSEVLDGVEDRHEHPGTEACPDASQDGDQPEPP
jgi:hypothetical protein